MESKAQQNRQHSNSILNIYIITYTVDRYKPHETWDKKYMRQVPTVRCVNRKGLSDKTP